MMVKELSFPAKNLKPTEQVNMEILAKQLADYIDDGFVSLKVVKAFCDTIFDEAKKLGKVKKKKEKI